MNNQHINYFNYANNIHYTAKYYNDIFLIHLQNFFSIIMFPSLYNFYTASILYLFLTFFPKSSIIMTF